MLKIQNVCVFQNPWNPAFRMCALPGSVRIQSTGVNKFYTACQTMGCQVKNISYMEIGSCCILWPKTHTWNTPKLWFLGFCSSPLLDLIFKGLNSSGVDMCISVLILLMVIYFGWFITQTLRGVAAIREIEPFQSWLKRGLMIKMPIFAKISTFEPRFKSFIPTSIISTTFLHFHII